MTAFDLNLVRIFDALMVHQSVSDAADALHMTQPAVSNALRRLRALTDDDLFVRTRRGMEPTPFALAAGPSLSEGLRLIRQGLERAAPFDPTGTRRRFRVLMTDAGEMVFLPRLMPLLRTKAPMLDIRVLQCPIARYLELLETDEADLAIGNLQPTAGTFVLRRLFDEHNVIVCKRGHSLELGAGPDRIARIEQVVASDHVVVRPPNSVSAALDTLVQTHHWKIRVALEVPHFMVLAGILDQTDMIAIVPSLVADELAQRSDLVILKIPFDCPAITIRLGWHIRQQKDQGSRWLRQQIIELMSKRRRILDEGKLRAR
ncbi:LysR family transcriptional regulator [Chelatococcus asaccharovorans]|uniref:LysR family transcriptional regulator n=1 Tax=Chelatococcus asaccharovorans TaxID=28210 RepID=A0A2V3UA39_9HYPH|nr:LysR family transcriptional regulator [Chelatococcus asaccharovorans]MBS7705463.1 LysR family transcriptional regulator [Chelatococcus asaccharovorans]PXW60134.1 LysR family transcriptional regulator [Chelatococcus asaccharovorans]CAH1655731.1 LysR family transcriptional regulator [Chelatococcus asaccharovorans]CAH1685327.1 LysR family transcriptional regulator [Chelatococcus asaccharovorans]